MQDIFFLTVECILAFVVIFSLPTFIKELRLYRKRDMFRCSLCGNCCRLKIISLTRDDIARLEARGFRDFAEERGERRLKRVNGRCIFLKDDRCTVHEHRPQVCRDFPFFVEYGIGYGVRATYCPGVEELENERGN